MLRDVRPFEGRRRARAAACAGATVFLLLLPTATERLAAGESSPAGSGPRGPLTFCMAPPVPQRQKPPPAPEFAPPLRELRFGLREARAGFSAPDTARVLFLLAEFADVPFDTAGIDTTGRPPGRGTPLLVDYFQRQLGFIREYYRDASYGRQAFVPTVHPEIVRLPFRMRYYGDDDRFGERGTKLIWDAVAGADAAVDYSAYTGLTIIHSGAGQESDIDDDSRDQIWSAFFPQPFLSLVMADSLGRDVPGIPTNDLDARGDSVFVTGAAMVPESESQDGFQFGIMGVFTHELGHVIAGWPDLYDTTPDDPSQGCGSFCLMAAGTWNANGNVPGEPSAWCREYAGWVDPVVYADAPPEGREITITWIEKDDPATGDVMLARVPIAGDEYFLISCRQPDPNDNRAFDWSPADPELGVFNFWTDSFAGAEFDYFSPNLVPSSPTPIYREAEGLYVWHIDESVVRFGIPFNVVNADPHHHGVDLEEADGLQELELRAYTILSFGSPDDAFRAGHATEISPWSEPSSRTSFGGESGVVIDQISAADSVMTFRLRFLTGADGGDGPVVRDGWPIALGAPVAKGQPLALDLDGVAGEELVVVDEAGTIAGFWPDGTPFAPAPPRASGAGTGPAGAPLAGDVDGDGTPELVVVGLGADATSSPIAAYRLVAGALELAYAVTLPDSLGPIEAALFDLDGTPGLELVVGTTDAGADSTEAKLFVVDLDAVPLEAVTALPVPGGVSGGPVVLGTQSGSVIVHPLAGGGLLVIDAAPSLGLSVSELVRDDLVFAGPAAADLDGDGFPELMATASDGGVYVFHVDTAGAPSSLRAAAGWPAVVFPVPGSGVSAADVDADGRAEVLAIGASGSIHVLNYNGTPLRGWPGRMDVPIDVFFDLSPSHPAPLAADVNGDGRLEVIAVTADGLAIAYAAGAGGRRRLRGWPIQGGHAVVPVVGDFDGDGETDLFTAGGLERDGRTIYSRATLYSLRAPFVGRTDDWRMHRRAASRNAAAGSSEDPLVTTTDFLSEVYCQPNPGRADGTRVHYALGRSADRVEIRFYDVTGQKVRELNGTAFAGADNLVRWDGRNDAGEPVAPGLYVFRVVAESGDARQSIVGKMAIVR